MQDSSQPLMTVNEITGRLEELDAALRIVETEGRELEEKIRKGITKACLRCLKLRGCWSPVLNNLGCSRGVASDLF